MVWRQINPNFVIAFFCGTQVAHLYQNPEAGTWHWQLATDGRRGVYISGRPCLNLDSCKRQLTRNFSRLSKFIFYSVKSRNKKRK